MHLARTIFNQSPLPRAGVKADLVFYEENPGQWPEFWTIRLYNNNLKLLTGEDQLVVARWLKGTIAKMQNAGLTVFPEKLESEEQ